MNIVLIKDSREWHLMQGQLSTMEQEKNRMSVKL